jgi:transcription initiation factor TFIIIB Brf1 subunit/transcription initiation factor TFIIB
MIKDMRKIKECPDCASRKLFYDDDKQQVICKKCGLIYEPLAPKLEEKFEKSHGM